MSGKKFSFAVSLIAALFFLSSFALAQDKKVHKYVGVKTCGMCHRTAKQGEQLKIWQNSKHSKAYETLKTDEANKIAKEKGFKTPAVETKECLECHATAWQKDAPVEAKFSVEDGVQCETCHGPGSDYKSFSIMKNRDKAIANGLILHEDKAKFCETCHNKKSPTFKSFDYDKMWAKIKHDIPGDKK